MNKRIDRGQITRHQIIDASTLLFAARGYEGVSIEAILQACGISRGALYHHFSSKEAIFTAVLEAAEEQVAARVIAASKPATNPLDGLRAGCAAWLALAARDATVRQIVLTDAPSVVGWRKWRELDGRYSLGVIKRAFAQAAEAGRVDPKLADIFAHMLLAVLVEVALLIARAPDDAGLLARANDAVERVLGATFGVEPNGRW
jgi:AcrR family transcriptional regulator